MQGDRYAMPNPEQTPTYLTIIGSIWPLAVAGVLSAMALNLKKAMKEDNVRDRIAALLVTSIPSAVVSVGVVLLLPLIIADTSKITPSVELGFAVVCGGLGTKVFDMWLRSKFNLIIKERDSDGED